MRFKKNRLCLGGMALLLLLTFEANAGRLYRFEDENGKMVMSDQVPANALSKGYSVLNSHGDVIETVAPALTEAQRAELARQQQQEQAQAKLLKTYSGPEDAERARDRQLELLDDQIKVKKGLVARLTSEKKRQNEAAADLERQGKNVYDFILQKIDSLEREINQNQQEITLREQEKLTTRARFEKDIQQLKTMQAKQQTPAAK